MPFVKQSSRERLSATDILADGIVKERTNARLDAHFVAATDRHLFSDLPERIRSICGLGHEAFAMIERRLRPAIFILRSQSVR